MPDTTPNAEAGRLQFELKELLGSGSFGDVYLAVMSSGGGIRQEVAVKLLAQQLDPRSQPLARLRDEGRILGSLNHPVILQVRDLVSMNGRVALVTEYVPGADLEKIVLDHGPLPSRVALQIVGHVADALDTAFHAHASDGRPMQLVHRDIKPANVRVTPHGTVKLLDFGIAKAQEPERETSTSHLVLIGSLPYMAPEALHLDENEAGMPRDVFALGVTLYELLTGQLFFEGLARRELRRITARPERYEAWKSERLERLGDVAPLLRGLLDRMLAYDPEDRPTARDVADDAHDAADAAEGPSLRSWARGHDWPGLGGSEGALTGRKVTETAMSRDTWNPGLTQFEVEEAAAASPAEAPVERDSLVGATAVPVPETAFHAGDDAAERPAVRTDAEPAPPDRSSRWLLLVALLLLVAGAGLLALALGGGTTSPAEAPAVVEAAPAAAPTPAPGEEVSTAPAAGDVPTALAGEDAAAEEAVDPVEPDAAAPEPEPAPEPVRVRQAPRTEAPVRTTPREEPRVTAPEPEPTVRPRVAPAGAATATLGERTPITRPTGRLRLVDTRGVAVELRRNGTVASPGEVAAGPWEVWADYEGDGRKVLALNVRVDADTTVKVACKKILQVCRVVP